MKIFDLEPPGALLSGVLFAASLATIVGIGILDYVTGPELSMAELYLIPAMTVAWYLGLIPALIIAGCSGVSLLLADALSVQPYASKVIPFLNAAFSALFLVIIAVLLWELKKRLVYEKQLASTDPLTGALNTRAFYERANLEIERAKRYGRTFSLAYLDLDNFKRVNDTNGHTVGDDLLCLVVHTIQQKIRATDFIARLGGDEFAIFYPELDLKGAEEASAALKTQLIAAARERGWDLTFSMGIGVYSKPPSDVIDLIRQVDTLMYTVKNTSKDSIAFRHFT